MRAFLGANLLVAVFCAFALLALIHGPDGVNADPSEKHQLASGDDDDNAIMPIAGAGVVPKSLLLRAKRDWKLDMKTEIQKNKAEPLEQQQHVIDDNANVPIAADGRGTVLPSSRTKRDYWEDLGYEKPKKLGEVVINGTVHPIMSCPSCRIN